VAQINILRAEECARELRASQNPKGARVQRAGSRIPPANSEVETVHTRCGSFETGPWVCLRHLLVGVICAVLLIPALRGLCELNFEKILTVSRFYICFCILRGLAQLTTVKKQDFCDVAGLVSHT
jgi:hypothetical protein